MGRIKVGLIGAGYIGMVHLFRDFYEGVAARREGKPLPAPVPDFRTGHEMMCVIDAAAESYRSGTWVRVRT